MPFTHPPELRVQLVAAVAAGDLPSAVATRLGVGVTTAYAWLGTDAPELVRRARPCFRCLPCPEPPPEPAAYSQLLGLYLGDGCLSRGRRAWVMRIACDDAWPGLADEAVALVGGVSENRVHRVAKQGCHSVEAGWQHWICLFPQHAPGKKHERRIVLEPWQQQVVAEHPGPFLRGLFHSDGWRGLNVAVKRAPDGFVTRYRYPRYEFTNKSDDIRRLCADALDRLGIAWRPNGPYRISVNRREAVAALDEHVGPKY